MKIAQPAPTRMTAAQLLDRLAGFDSATRTSNRVPTGCIQHWLDRSGLPPHISNDMTTGQQARLSAHRVHSIARIRLVATVPVLFIGYKEHGGVERLIGVLADPGHADRCVAGAPSGMKSILANEAKLDRDVAVDGLPAIIRATGDIAHACQPAETVAESRLEVGDHFTRRRTDRSLV